MDFSQAKIWALLDDRQGNTNQTLGVAEALGVPFEIRKIQFNELIRIPNIITNYTKIWAKGDTDALLTSPWPDIVITTARRLGIVASYIKYHNPKTFIAQIQWPGFPSSQFDLIAAPKHDNVKMAPNIFVTVGAPHRVTEDKLRKDAELWRQKVTHMPAPRIAVLVGGDAGSRSFNIKHAKDFAAQISQFASTMGGSLMITTSRRTNIEAEKAIVESLTVPHYFHSWHNATSDGNPFYGFLGLADIVITTGDSISMCSEGCATGKPVYIYASDEFVSPKHRQFIDELYAIGVAKPLLANDNNLFTPPLQLNESQVIADEIKKRYIARII